MSSNVSCGFRQADLNGDNPLYLFNEDVLVGGSALNTNEVVVEVSFSDLSGGKEILPARPGYSYRIEDIYLGSNGTNFSGGDRDATLGDTVNSVLYTTIPAATLQSLSDNRWGDTGLPYPSLGNINSLSNSGSALRILQSSGTTNYTSGELFIRVRYRLVENLGA